MGSRIGIRRVKSGGSWTVGGYHNERFECGLQVIIADPPLTAYVSWLCGKM